MVDSIAVRIGIANALELIFVLCIITLELHLTCILIYIMGLLAHLVYVLCHNQSDCGELCISFNPYSFLKFTIF